MKAELLDQSGRAYGRKAPSYDPVLAEVGPGTPGGELLRRYWQPFALSSEATALPKLIRRLGEDLILFRNKDGEPGLLYPRCAHRGTSLLYGRVEEDGIRCCYHGWKFSNQGVCLDQPCEPEGGRNRNRIRQPWYPVVEMYGAIFAYMGPAEKQPLLPAFSCFDGLQDDEEVRAWYFGDKEETARYPLDYNWFQAYDNGPDHFHVPILHDMISGSQFTNARIGGLIPEVEWKYSEAGDSVLTFVKRAEGQDVYIRVEQCLLPNFLALPPFTAIGHATDVGAIIPIDDTHCVKMIFERVKKGTPPLNLNDFGGVGPERKPWSAMTAEEHQLYPNDYEAQSGQGPVTLHSEEHLASSDLGIAMLRRLFKQQCETVANGGDPVGVAFKEEDRRVVIEAKAWVMTPDGKEIYKEEV